MSHLPFCLIVRFLIGISEYLKGVKGTDDESILAAHLNVDISTMIHYISLDAKPMGWKLANIEVPGRWFVLIFGATVCMLFK